MLQHLCVFLFCFFSFNCQTIRALRCSVNKRNVWTLGSNAHYRSIITLIVTICGRGENQLSTSTSNAKLLKNAAVCEIVHKKNVALFFFQDSDHVKDRDGRFGFLCPTEPTFKQKCPDALTKAGPG